MSSWPGDLKADGSSAFDSKWARLDSPRPSGLRARRRRAEHYQRPWDYECYSRPPAYVTRQSLRRTTINDPGDWSLPHLALNLPQFVSVTAQSRHSLACSASWSEDYRSDQRIDKPEYRPAAYVEYVSGSSLASPYSSVSPGQNNSVSPAVKWTETGSQSVGVALPRETPKTEPRRHPSTS